MVHHLAASRKIKVSHTRVGLPFPVQRERQILKKLPEKATDDYFYLKSAKKPSTYLVQFYITSRRQKKEISSAISEINSNIQHMK